MFFLEEGFVKSSYLLIVDNREREMEGTTKREVRRDTDCVTGLEGTATQFLATSLEVCSMRVSVDMIRWSVVMIRWPQFHVSILRQLTRSREIKNVVVSII